MLRAFAIACCVVLTPAFAAGTTLTQQRVDPAVVPGPMPAVQWHEELAAFDGGYFVGWVDSRTSDLWPDLSGAMFDLQGARVAGPFRIAGGTGLQEQQAIACGTQVCLVAYAFAGRVFARRFDFSGNAVDSETAALPVSGLVPNYSNTPAVTFDGVQFLVVWRATATHGRRITEAGVMGPEVQLLASQLEWLRLVTGPAGMLLAYGTSGDQMASRVFLADGGLSAATTHGSNLYYDGLSSAAGASGFIVTWANALTGDRYAARVDASGASLDPGGILLGTIGGPPIAAAEVDGGYLLVNANSNDLDLAHVSSASGALTALAGVSMGLVDVRDAALSTQSGQGLLAYSVAPLSSNSKLAVRRVLGGALSAPLPQLGPESNSQLRPAVAHGPTGFLAAWEDERLDGGTVVRVAPLDEQGQPVSAALNVAPGPAQRTPALAADGSRYVLVWKQLEGTSTIKAVWLDSTGATTGQVFTAASSISATWDRPAVASGPAGVVVAWTSYTPTGFEAFTALVADGGVAAPVQVTSGAGGLQESSLAFGGGVFALVSSSESRNTVELTRLDSHGAALAGGQLTIASALTEPLGTAVASDGQQFLAVWAATSPSGKRWGVYARRFLPSGQMIDAAPLVLFDATEVLLSSNDTYPRPAVAFDGQNFIVTYSRLDVVNGGDVVQQRVSPQGTVSPQVVVEGGADDQTEVAITAGTMGRVLFAYRTYDRMLEVPRVAVRVVADVPTGGFCASDVECQAGTCVSGVCCAADGGCTLVLPDGGTVLPDGGLGTGGGSGGGGGGGAGGGTGQSPGTYRIGCGCTSPAGAPLLVLLALALRSRRARRTQRR